MTPKKRQPDPEPPRFCRWCKHPITANAVFPELLVEMPRGVARREHCRSPNCDWCLPQYLKRGGTLRRDIA